MCRRFEPAPDHSAFFLAFSPGPTFFRPFGTPVACFSPKTALAARLPNSGFYIETGSPYLETCALKPKPLLTLPTGLSAE